MASALSLAGEAGYEYRGSHDQPREIPGAAHYWTKDVPTGEMFVSVVDMAAHGQDREFQVVGGMVPEGDAPHVLEVVETAWGEETVVTEAVAVCMAMNFMHEYPEGMRVSRGVTA